MLFALTRRIDLAIVCSVKARPVNCAPRDDSLETLPKPLIPLNKVILFCPCGSTITRLLLDEPLIAAVFSKRVIL
jgi:hypothetical protein